jgi:hypothetical protein
MHNDKAISRRARKMQLCARVQTIITVIDLFYTGAGHDRPTIYQPHIPLSQTQSLHS